MGGMIDGAAASISLSARLRASPNAERKADLPWTAEKEWNLIGGE